MHMITLTSDWNDDDYYVASLKGKLLSLLPGIEIVDITHRVKPFNTAQAAFIVRNSFNHFPRGTVHIIAVNTEPEKGRALLAAKISGHYFLCADNGIIDLLDESRPEELVSLDQGEGGTMGSFAALNILAEAATKIAGGASPEEVGKKTGSYLKQVPLRPAVAGKVMTGTVIYIDSYENAITNITREYFEEVTGDRPFTIYVQSKHHRICQINKQYNESPEGELLAIFNSAGYLEIAIRNGNAAGLMKLGINSSIRIEFT